MAVIFALVCLQLLLTPGHVRRTIDGDTFVLYHVGVPAEERVRLIGFDAPERGEPLFAESQAALDSWLKAGAFVFRACRRDSFGRYLGEVERDGVVYVWRAP